jgi:hypothetical protein
MCFERNMQEFISAFEENILHTIDALFAFIVGVFDQLN